MRTVRNLLDTMAANKLNVLHLHASDVCRWGVESKVYPNLTASLTGVRAGVYSHEDVREMISYAGARGIRVVPEFDVPAHSHCLIALEGEGVNFCTDLPTRLQLWGDPQNQTLGVLLPLLKEMASLFSDEAFHIGGDETLGVGPCTVQSTVSLERQLFDYVRNALGKTPASWEEACFGT